MMIERDCNVFYVECDGIDCTNYLMVDSELFNDVLIKIKNSGWISVNKDGDWFHYCPICQS